MLSTIFQGSSVPVLEQVVSFTRARHEILAGNIANLDTPGYRIRDLSPERFQTRLREALEARRRQTAAPLSPGAIPYQNPVGTASLDDVNDDMRSILFHDDSDVGLEQQLIAMSKNQGLYNLALSIMTSQFRLLQAVISERA